MGEGGVGVGGLRCWLLLRSEKGFFSLIFFFFSFSGEWADITLVCQSPGPSITSFQDVWSVSAKLKYSLHIQSFIFSDQDDITVLVD